MTLHRLETAPPPALARALAYFEMGFTYPLGPGRTFRISHGEDYPRFFRAIGKACSFVEERDGQVLGVLGVAVRPLLLPDGGERMVGYFGDLKLAANARSGFVLRRLVQAAAEWLKPQTDCAYSVVMDGTRVVPTEYTGRVGIPEFRELGKVVVLRILHNGNTSPDWNEMSVPPADDCFRDLSRGRFATLGGTPDQRSEIEPAWLAYPLKFAVGRLEDTRRAKRLIAGDGTELLSAHFSCFVYRNPLVGSEVLCEASIRANRRGFPALFVSVPAADVDGLCRCIDSSFEVTRAPATIYGTGLPSGFDWNINTSEI